MPAAGGAWSRDEFRRGLRVHPLAAPGAHGGEFPPRAAGGAAELPAPRWASAGGGGSGPQVRRAQPGAARERRGAGGAEPGARSLSRSAGRAAAGTGRANGGQRPPPLRRAAPAGAGTPLERAPLWSKHPLWSGHLAGVNTPSGAGTPLERAPCSGVNTPLERAPLGAGTSVGTGPPREARQGIHPPPCLPRAAGAGGTRLKPLMWEQGMLLASPGVPAASCPASPRAVTPRQVPSFQPLTPPRDFGTMAVRVQQGPGPS